MSSVNDIMLNQQQTAAAIESLYTNFKKDSATRKTNDYIRRKLELLDNYWSDYEASFSKLSEMDIDSSSRNYFVSDFEKVQDRYRNIRTAIDSYQPISEERAPSPVIKPPTFVPKMSDLNQDKPQAGSSKATHSSRSTATASKSDEMLRKQSSNFKAFHYEVMGINLESINEKWELQDLLNTLQQRWAAIDSLHWELDSLLDGCDEKYESTFATYSQKYKAIKRAINQKMWSTVHMDKATPRMEIPTFSGNFHTWVSFKDLFNETIHSNTSMSNAQKMQYLKSKVRGEAERLIQHLNVSADNYNVCWEILNQRFNNKYLIFNSHMDILLNLPVTQQQSAMHLKRMHDTTQECLNAIKNLGVDISSSGPIIVYLLTKKLDATSHVEFTGMVKNPRELPDLQEFLKYLEAKFTALEASRRKQDTPIQKSYQMAGKGQSSIQNISNQKSNYYKTFATSKKIAKPMTSNNNYKTAATTTKYYCPLCHSEEHGIYFCKQFLDMPPSNRLRTVTKLNLCINCLYDHYGKPCLSDKLCRQCNKGHNRLLHESFAQSQSRVVTGDGTSASAVSEPGRNAHITKNFRTGSHVSLQEDCVEVLLPTALIAVQAEDGSQHVMRALLDQGSQVSLITEHAAQILKIQRKRCMGVVTGIGDGRNNIKGVITIRCTSMVSDYSFETEVIIMNKLVKNLPSQAFSKPDWPYLDHITLADPEFYRKRPVDILLGADIYSRILMDGICRVDSTLPTGQQTRLGYILSGNIRSFHCNVVLHNIDELQRFWQIEDVHEQSELSLEDSQCIEFYQKTTTRRENGSYEVRLPLKADYREKLGLSKMRAIAQFYKLERKIINNPAVGTDYRKFMDEYLSLGHMIPAENCHDIQFYLPHHCVTREDSTTTKLRVVFNASEKTTSGVSLNDIMCRGPNLQQDLQGLLLRWRQYKYAMTADIEKMFRQIWVNKEDQNLQMIMWRNNQSELLKEYLLTTVTYGTKAAPFLAMMTLKQLAQDEQHNYSASAAPGVLREAFYMDDLAHGSHSIQSGKQLQSDLISLLRAGGFNLRKWRSNSPELLEEVTQYEQQESLDFKQVESTKALGIRWNPKEDYFTFNIEFLKSEKSTKRSLLSEISKIFDPLGWLSPLTTKLKILYQDIWRSNLQWDEFVPTQIQEEWSKIQQDLCNISKIQIPRWIQTMEKGTIELHGFSDASTKAYGCVVYCKIIRNNRASVVIIAGKTKIVPLSKKYSLPRLELCGAVLLSKLICKIKECLTNYDIVTYGWIDSMVVLGWINGEVGRWKPFVANRISQILSSMPAKCWRYVASKDNPADCASRGLTATQLKEHTLWFTGPSWLPTYTPEKEQNQNYFTNQEIRNNKQVNVILAGENDTIKQILNKHNSLRKVIRILAWILRFQNKGEKQSYLYKHELIKANNLLVKIVQEEIFFEEMNQLKQKKCISTSSKIYNLNPILDEFGILRVGGRLRHAYIDPEMKHPAIIPSNTRLADLIIDQAHDLTYHGGARLTTANIRRKYWLIGGNNATKKRLRLCVKCKKQNPSTLHQIMGDLPSARINPSRPFYHCGVDYTGHFTVKANKGRGIKTTKGYVAVFVCMATKAVHLELVSDMTSAAFIAALRRMSARRGLPGHMYSDQGKNFIGADKVLRQELSELYKIFNQQFMDEIATMNIEWHFNAPSWPSAGGLWESAVRSLKHHLKRVIGEQNLTYEEFSTLLSCLEGCLNSRPLCPLTEDPNDIEFLTPSHFLSSGPTLTLYDTEHDLRTRWHLTQKIYNDIWRRWKEEYLVQLTARSKWRKPQANIQINDVVVIKDDNLPPGKWALGRVVELHPGSDGYVRVVTLKTKNGIMQRPVVKLSVLPVYQEQEQKNQNNGNSIEQKSNRKTKKCSNFVTMAISLLLMFCISVPPVQCLYNITQFQGNNSIYFDRVMDMQIIRGEWRLVVFYDTEPYREGDKALAKNIQYLDHLCKQIVLQSHCDGIIWQLRHEVIELEYYNGMLINHNVNKQVRRRRGLINFIGNVANDLFGVLDDRFAEKYESDISLIRQNQNHLASLWKNQTSIVEAEFNLIKRSEALMNRHHKLINQKLLILQNAANQAKVEIQNQSIVSEFLSTAMITNNLILKLKNIQQVLLDAITNIYSGKFDFHLLPPEQMRHELRIISEQLPKDIALPIQKTDSLSALYSLLQVQAKVTTRYVLLELNIPLIGEDMYEILRLIPVPQPLPNSREVMVIPVAKYVSVNLNHEMFLELSEEELSSCVPKGPQLTFCHIKKPIQVIQDDQSFCETQFTPRRCKTIVSGCKNRWIELHAFNTYFYFFCEPYQVKLVCSEQISLLKLANSGFFQINQACTIKLADSIVYSHRLDTSQVEVSPSIPIPEVSQINHIINISLPDLSLSSTDMLESAQHIEQLQNIERNIQNMKDSVPLLESKAASHNSHHYTAIYILYALVALGMLGYAFRYIQHRMEMSPARESAPTLPPAQLHAVTAAPLQTFQTDNPSASVQPSEVNESCARVSIQSKVPFDQSAVSVKEKGCSPIDIRSGFKPPVFDSTTL